MTTAARGTYVSDRTLARIVRTGLVIIAIGIPLLAVLYVLDREPQQGNTLGDRQIAAAEEAVRAAPSQIGLRLALAQLYRVDGRTDEALAQFDEVLKVDKHQKTALLGRADILLAGGDHDSAQAAYRKVIKLATGAEFSQVDPQLEAAHYGLASSLSQGGRTRSAVAELEAALKIDPTDADAWYLLGSTQLAAGAAGQAVEAFRRAVLFVPTGWCEPYASLSTAYTKLRRTAFAESAGAMADYCETGDAAAATARLEPLAAGPARIDAMLGLGMIAEASANGPAAVAWYRKVLAADSGNFNARAGLTRLGASPALRGQTTPPETAGQEEET